MFLGEGGTSLTRTRQSRAGSTGNRHSQHPYRPTDQLPPSLGSHDATGQRGQGIVEYALVIFLVAITIIAVFAVLGDQVTAVISSLSDTLQSILPAGALDRG